MALTGIQAFIEMLHEFGVRYVFGNPGSTELPLNDELARDRRLQYVLGLQEVPVTAMADGYSMASGTLGVVNLHISCGLGNAMGMIYNAHREGTPLLITAGQQDRRLMFEEPILTGDMVAVTRPWTKWSAEVNRVQDLPNALRRAAQMALTPPTGPVFLSLPVDVQMELSDELDLTPIQLPDPRVAPPVDAVERASALLREAENPAILAGSRVAERNAGGELVELAELLGAPVISESGTTHGRLAFPCDHPLYGQGLPLWSPEVRDRLAEYDVLLVTGMDLLRQYVYHEPARAIPESCRLVHLDEDPWQIGKNYPVEVPLIGHTKVGLRQLHDQLSSQLTDADRSRFQQRAANHAARHGEARQLLRDRVTEETAIRPMTPLGIMSAIAEVIPNDVAVVEEAVTTTNTTLERLGALKNTTGYFGHRGWALGWGLGCAVGVQLAWPDRPVLGILGEGATMYGVQGLWTAARHQIPVTFVVCNNAQYQILKIGAKGLSLPQAQQDNFEGLDLTGPDVDIVRVAEGLGIRARRIEDRDELIAALPEAFESGVPELIDVPISRQTQSRLNYG